MSITSWKLTKRTFTSIESVARDPGPTVITERGERMAAEGDNGTLPQMTTGVLNNGNS